jgi:transitional endoplasmic reticulum ATPase
METTAFQKQPADANPEAKTITDLHWWSEFQTAIESGKRCVGLTFNTSDYTMPKDGLPRPLLPHLYQHFKEQEYDLIITYSLSRGIEIFEQDTDKESKFRRYTGLSHESSDAGNGQPIPPSVILHGLNKLITQDTLRVLLVLDYAQHIAPAMQAGMASVASEDQISSVELLHAWSLDNYLNTKTKNVVVAILREGQFHELLSEHWKVIRIDMPSANDIQRFYTMLSNLEKKGEQPFASVEENISVEEAARASVGLRLRTIEEMSRRAAVKKQSVTLQAIKAEKSREIQRLCGDVLEVLETNITFDDLAGLEYVKAFYRQINEQVKRGYRNIPQGLLLVGPPGCGKSFQIRSFANELGWNCMMMRSVRSMWVGESERNLERVLNTIQSNLPAILFIDEVDQMLGQRGQGGDAGTSERMLARLWEFMAQSEHRGRLIFAAASNRPDLLDVASVDRFQYVIPILQPTAEEFRAVLPNVARQLERTLDNSLDLPRIARLMQQKGLSVRQTVDVMAMAALKSDLSGNVSGAPISESALWETANNFRSNHDPAQIEAITLEAIRMTTFAELLPWFSAPEEYPFPDFLRRLMNEKYEIDLPALEKRLHELKQQLMYSKMMR